MTTIENFLTLEDDSTILTLEDGITPLTISDSGDKFKHNIKNAITASNKLKHVEVNESDYYVVDN